MSARRREEEENSTERTLSLSILSRYISPEAQQPAACNVLKVKGKIKGTNAASL